MPNLDDLPANVANKLDSLIDGIWDGRVDPGLLESCRQRICELLEARNEAGRHHTCPAPTEDHPGLPDFLSFVEMWTFDPHSITDDQAAAVRAHLTDTEVASFSIAIATIEALIRIDTALAQTT